MIKSFASRPLCYVVFKSDSSPPNNKFCGQRYITIGATLRIRLLPRVPDGEPHTRPGMQDTGLGEEFVGQFRHPLPHHIRSLAATAELPMPKANDMGSERIWRRAVRRHGVISEIPGDDLRELLPDFGNRHVPSLSKCFLDFPQLCLHSIPSRLPS